MIVTNAPVYHYFPFVEVASVLCILFGITVKLYVDYRYGKIEAILTEEKTERQKYHAELVQIDNEFIAELAKEPRNVERCKELTEKRLARMERHQAYLAIIKNRLVALGIRFEDYVDNSRQL